jgi:hypothetical protein
LKISDDIEAKLDEILSLIKCNTAAGMHSEEVVVTENEKSTNVQKSVTDVKEGDTFIVERQKLNMRNLEDGSTSNNDDICSMFVGTRPDIDDSADYILEGEYIENCELLQGDH